MRPGTIERLQRETRPDQEWKQLVLEALQIGIPAEDIKQFLERKRSS
ncbi:anti-repressor SinI family protein [Alkalicoccus luteus]|uniref:DNA-binding anti-repressor SinI n=1 Tax=Alkalicoccus luteus TaxID=1237094 RepID=A0A969PMX5_9BACI|nr:anti-repressor SinI family protein [Alkalicoccus luteus]NJP37160.1 DNA-binding anti-repressor SinI [Alkalicoccus luteus]